MKEDKKISVEEALEVFKDSINKPLENSKLWNSVGDKQRQAFAVLNDTVKENEELKENKERCYGIANSLKDKLSGEVIRVKKLRAEIARLDEIIEKLRTDYKGMYEEATMRAKEVEGLQAENKELMKEKNRLKEKGVKE